MRLLHDRGTGPERRRRIGVNGAGPRTQSNLRERFAGICETEFGEYAKPTADRRSGLVCEQARERERRNGS